MTRACAIGLLTLAVVSPAAADEYWITYEGNDFPENEGWHRTWGNSKGQFRGNGAMRTIENGALVMDSLFDTSVYDFYSMERLGRFDPEPGELFRAEWRLLVEETVNWYDPSVVIRSDDGNLVAFEFREDNLLITPSRIRIDYEPFVWHTFSFSSLDMLTFDLAIDGQFVHRGEFLTRATPDSRFAFGDGTQGAASLASWDYVRFGVVPEPTMMSYLLCLLVACGSQGVRVRIGGGSVP